MQLCAAVALYLLFSVCAFNAFSIILSTMAKILLVEDDLMLLKLVCQHLRGRLHVVDAVGDADEAAAYLDVGDFDLVIMDWCLPGQSGLTGSISVLATDRRVARHRCCF